MTVLVLLHGQAPGARVPHVLIVGPIDSYGALVAGVSEGLQAGGFQNRSQVVVIVRNARHLDEAKAVIREALGDGLDAIVTIFSPATEAARAATSTVPIVFCPVADPVAAKFAASTERPGGNVTGVASVDAEATRRRLQVFRRVLPDLRRLVVLFDPGFPPDRIQIASLEQVAPARGLVLSKEAVGDSGAAVRALQALDRGQVDAVFIPKEALLRHARDEIGRVVVGRRLPLLVAETDLADLPGVLAAAGPDFRQIGRLGGMMTAAILKGATPGAMAVEHPEFGLAVNLKVAGQLGIVVPPEGLSQAARVIR